VVLCRAVKRDALTWTLALLLAASSACLPNDPSDNVVDRDDPLPAPTVDEDDAVDDSPDDTDDNPIDIEPDPDPQPDPDPEPDPDPDPEVTELPPIPYELEELPDGVSAPWPGGAVHGALVEVLEATDGDTVKIDTDDGLMTVRIVGINAPECDKHSSEHGKSCDPSDQDFSGVAEPFGVEAWEGLSELIEGQNVRLACREVSGECETDRYDRVLAFLVIDGTDVSEYMTANGLAYTYTQFPPSNIYTYCVAEDAAIHAELGIWSDGRDPAITRRDHLVRRASRARTYDDPLGGQA